MVLFDVTGVATDSSSEDVCHSLSLSNRCDSALENLSYRLCKPF